MLKLLRMSASLKSSQRHLASVAMTSFSGTQQTAGGDFGVGERYGVHRISFVMQGSDVSSSPPGGDGLGFPEKEIQTHEESKMRRRTTGLEAIIDGVN